MNYIMAINSFWDSATLNPLSTGQVSLYFALLHINNRSNWTEWFTAPNQVLSILTGMSRSGISKARNELRQRGIIDFRERGTKATLYKLLTIANSTQDGAQNSSTLNKHKQKQKQKSVTNVTPEKYCDDPVLNQAILAFIAFREEIKSPMTAHAIDLLLKKLDDIAPEDNSAKAAILNQSIMNGWKGVFPLEKRWQGKAKPQERNQFQDFPQRNTDYDEIISAQLKEMGKC